MKKPQISKSKSAKREKISKSAGELCAKLLLKSLKNLNEDEEEMVVDYLESVGIEADFDLKSNDLCLLLLKHKMKEDLGTDNMAALRPYANKLLESGENVKRLKDEQESQQKILNNRLNISKNLKSMDLPGCVADRDIGINLNVPYTIIVNPELGIMTKSDGTRQYRSAVSVSQNLYDNIFLKHEQPILELKSTDNEIAYARIEEMHSENNVIYVSPLTFNLLNTKNMLAFIKLCQNMPVIDKIDFTYYGDRKSLDIDLPMLIQKVPDTINAFSYASLGLVFTIPLDDKSVMLRVDKLLSDGKPIYAGILAFGENDLPFDIEPDL